MYNWRSTQRSTIAGFPLIGGLIALFFILLVIIMISSSMVTLPGTRVKLPEIANVDRLSVDRLIITVTEDSSLFFNGMKLTLPQLDAELRKCASESNDAAAQASAGRGNGPYARKPMVVVCADRNLQMAQWLEIAEVIRNIGLDVYLASEAQSGPAR
ncbi:MAG: biopolymer transporter ExbD [Victivallales bacterium]|nr:biopolymer transporter ExbD [Victivallales bacterium]